jgi:wobble nucleotide-excising tRNase
MGEADRKVSDLEAEVKKLRRDLDKLIGFVYRIEKSNTNTLGIVIELTENLNALIGKVQNNLPAVFPKNSGIIAEMNRAIDKARRQRR